MKNLAETLKPIQQQLQPGRKFRVDGGEAQVKNTCTTQPRGYCMYSVGAAGHPCPFIANRSFWSSKAARDSDMHDGCQIAVALSGEKGSLIPPADKGAGLATAKSVGRFQRQAIEATGHQVPCTVFQFSFDKLTG